MATKVVDAAAAKQRQQKLILIVGGVLLVALLAFQGPKVLKQLKGSKASTSAASTSTTTTTTPDTTTTTPGATTTTPSTGTTGTSSVATVGSQSAQVAGILIRTAGTPQPQTGQLWSLSRFKAKDPFVQQVTPATGTSTGAGGGAYPGGTKPGTVSTPKTGAATGSVVIPSAPTAAQEAFAYATLMVNGKPLQLQLKQLFPKAQPTFVLTGVAKQSIKIRVAGGKFTDGAAVVLERGKTVTLMNTVTGQRFVMKLVFTGSQPEQIAGFKQPAAQTTTTTSTP